jgi:hypothetical protein
MYYPGIVVSVCNTSYSGGRSRQMSSRKAWEKLARPYLKTKIKGWVWCSNTTNYLRSGDRRIIV